LNCLIFCSRFRIHSLFSFTIWLWSYFLSCWLQDCPNLELEKILQKSLTFRAIFLFVASSPSWFLPFCKFLLFDLFRHCLTNLKTYHRHFFRAYVKQDIQRLLFLLLRCLWIHLVFILLFLPIFLTKMPKLTNIHHQLFLPSISPLQIDLRFFHLSFKPCFNLTLRLFLFLHSKIIILFYLLLWLRRIWPKVLNSLFLSLLPLPFLSFFHNIQH